MDLAAIQGLLQGSKTYDLGLTLHNGMPHHPRHTPFMYAMVRKHGDWMYPENVSSAVDMFVCSGHTGTHLDGLGHYTRNLTLHGGTAAAGAQSVTDGLAVHGMERVAPIVRRGILLDVAAHRKATQLPPRYGIEAGELEAVAAWAGLRIDAGDVVLVRTGWIHRWPDGGFYDIEGGAPGLTLSAARWLSDRRVHVAGADNFALEVQPVPSMPVHCHLLVEKGIHILEVANLEELSGDRVYEFLFVALPLKIRGATGSPVRPIAIA